MMEWISMRLWWKDIDRGMMKYTEKNMCDTNPTCISLESNRLSSEPVWQIIA